MHRLTGRHRATVAAALVLLALDGAGCRVRRVCGTRPEPRVAELVLLGGRVYTVVPTRPWAQALAVRGGRLVHVGDDAGARAWIGAGTRRVELDGRMVLPGFHDSHLHPLAGGVGLGECDLGKRDTVPAVLAEIRRWARAEPRAPWVRGNGWALTLFEGASPSRRLLDEAVPDRPAFFTAADGHSAWVNSRALAIAGIGRGTPDPPNGRIERDADGEPSGTLREDAIELVRSKLPRRTAAERVAGLRRALALAARHGLTSLFEANADADELAAYAELERRGELGARVAVSLATDLAAGARQLPRLVELRRRHRGPRLRVLGAKIFVDGVLESRTAALLEPYLDRPGQRGKLAAAPRSLAALVVALDGAGLQVHAHAIGDAAVRATLDALGEARRRNGPRDGRHHIAHVQLVHPDDLRRFGRLGVTATVQPLWAWADEYITKLTLPALGAARARWIYPFASLARAGAELACGSDWDVTSIAPLEAIQVGVTRRAPDAAAGPAWLPAEVLDLRALLRCYTLAGARLAFQERLTGTLEPGKAADLVVLERDLFALAATEIARTRVVLTLLEGRPTWSDGQLLPRAP